MDLLRRLVAYVEAESGGDEVIIFSAGMAVRATASPIGELPAPVDFLATIGDMDGEIDLTWDPVRGAKVYMIQCKPHTDAGEWKLVKPVTDSKATVGTAGQGPWSDVSVKRAP